MEQRLRLVTRYRLRAFSGRLAELNLRAQRCSPRMHLARTGARHERLTQRLIGAMRADLRLHRQRLDELTGTLHAISPLATLDRGYALVTRADGVLLRDSANAIAGDTLHVRLSKGRLTVEVK